MLDLCGTLPIVLNQPKEGCDMTTTLLDIPTVRHELSAGESTIRRWIREGRLPTVRLGRRVLVRRDALDKFVRAGGQPAKPAASKMGAK
jgi:excisionase family DNA binding protein